MTPSAEVRAIRILGRAEALGWPQVVANGISVTTEAHWRNATDLPGNLAGLETQLNAISAKYDRPQFVLAPGGER